MPEYIEREILKSEMTEAMCGTGYQQWAIDVIDRLPTADVVEVVRCKDCELYKAYSDPLEGFYGQCLVRECDIGENDFCSYGKRKEGEEE